MSETRDWPANGGAFGFVSCGRTDEAISGKGKNGVQRMGIRIKLPGIVAQWLQRMKKNLPG
jgi:hypothetical protein